MECTRLAPAVVAGVTAVVAAAVTAVTAATGPGLTPAGAPARVATTPSGTGPVVTVWASGAEHEFRASNRAW